MNWHRIHRLGLAVGVMALVAAACGPSTTTSSSSWATATSASGGGGMTALIAAAKAEGQLNVIALPPNWANYGAIISGFTAKYGIPITSANPSGNSQDEVNAITAGTTRAPDVVDAVSYTHLTLP